MSSVDAAVQALSAAFAARDVDAAMACFAAGDDIGYVGSERAETATGRRAVTELFGAVFARDEAYSWQITASTIREYGDHAYLVADAAGLVHTDAGQTSGFPYRISGLLCRADGRWLWRHCQGSEPTGDG
jgi:ketosteroid isomerase-like protein